MNRFRQAIPGILALITAILFFIGAYNNITVHYVKIGESTLSLAMVIVAALLILTGVVISVVSVLSILGYDKDT